MIEPIPVVAYAGEPLTDALALYSTDYIDSIGCYTDEAFTSFAGSFIDSTNTFTPVYAAVGSVKLYLRVDLNYDIDCSIQAFEVDFNTPIQPPPVSPQLESGNDIQAGEISIFPNPAQKQARITGLPEGIIEVLLYNGQGQVLKTFITADAEQSYLDMNLEGIPVGMYWVKAGQEARAIVVQ